MSGLEPLALSLLSAGLAAGLALAAGLGLALLLVRRKLPARPLWEGLVMMPLVLPPAATGYLLLLLFRVDAPLGGALAAAGLRLPFSFAAVVLSAFVAALPLAYQACRSALLGVDPELEDAGRTLGLGEPGLFFRVTLPLAWPGVLGGFALAFARSLGEFGGTIVLAGNIPGRTRTLPLALYAAMEAGREAEAGAYLLLSLGMGLVLAAFLGLARSRAEPAEPGRARRGAARAEARA